MFRFVPAFAVTEPPLVCIGDPSVVLIVVNAVLPVVCKADVAAPVGSEIVPAILLMLLV